MKNIRTKLLLSILLITCSLALTGAMLWDGKVLLDVEAVPVFCGYSISEIQKKEDVKTSFQKNSGVLTSGIVQQVSTDGKKLTIIDNLTDNKSKNAPLSVVVDVPKNKREEVKKYQIGMHLTVCGEAKVPLGFSKEIRIKGWDFWQRNDSFREGNECWVKIGDRYEAFKSSKTSEVSLHRSAFTYCVPNSWSSRQLPLEEKDYLEGYEYVLDQIPDDYGNLHEGIERLCVFYFDNSSGLKYSEDKNNTRRIESSIVRNILNTDDHPKIKFRTRKTFADYGTEFTYYSEDFKDKNNSDTNVEFVFIPDGNVGIFTMVYINKNPIHREEIIYMMHTIKNRKD